ncbi:cytochrome P450 [Streptomyces afghaniensis]|uniref:cytochrome P450 n=1 Tax=Streptomyces afghaniensis TaxID=66865 RepID=UPI0037B963DA
MASGYDTKTRGLAWLHRCLADERAEYGLAFNPLRDAFQKAPEDAYAELRRRSPVHYSRLLDCWIVTRYEEVAHLLRENDVFRSSPHTTTQALVDPYATLDPDRPSLFMLDPPAHTRLRGAVREAFGPEAVRRLTPHLEECVRDVVQRLGRPGDRVDLVPRFAGAIPLRVLDLVTGLDMHGADDVTGWVSDIVLGLEPIATAQTAQRALTSYRALGKYLDERRARPAREGSLHWSLLRSVRAGRLTDAEARQLLMFLVLAGTKTVSDFLASAARHLSALPPRAPERRHVDSALVDDLIARVSPVQIVARTAAVPTVLCGRRIRAGQRILLVLASANRDLAAGAREDGGETGTGRARRAVAFGGGIHRCLGAHLARLEGRYALSYLLERFPEVRLTGATPSRRCVTLRSWDSVIVHL